MDHIRAQIYGMMLWMAIRTGVREMYRLNPVTSDIISTEELMIEHSSLYIDMMLDMIKGVPLVEIKERYADRIAFIQSVTNKI